MQATNRLVDFIVGLRFEELDTETVQSVKKQVLDTLATMLGGGNSEGIRELYELVKDWGGRKESGVINFGGRFPAPNAALVNAAMAHALDYDDTYEEARLHCAVVAVPSALAVAQSHRGLTGTDLITAIAAGVDIECRLGMAAKLTRPHVLEGGWHFTSLFGYFSAAAIAGKLLGFDREKMINALGIAYHQAAGNLQCIVDGALTKRIGAGLAARGGITAAIMADKGITGARDIIDGEVGIFNLYHAGYDEELLIGNLGKKFSSAGTSFKPYPCCRIIHPYLDGLFKLVMENDIKPDEVIEIIPVTSNASQLLCEPFEIRTEPRNIVDSQFSLPWALACAVVRRKAGLDEYTNESIKDQTLMAMARKVRPHYDASLPNSLEMPFIVRIKTRKGDFELTTIGHILGSSENSLTLDFITDKFRDCAVHAVKPLSNKNIEKVVDCARNLEKVNDIEPIMRLLC